MLSSTFFFLVGGLARCALGSSNLETHVDSLELESDFDPVVLSEFMSNPHHHRTPFAVRRSVLIIRHGNVYTSEISPDGKNCYIAYLEGSSNVHVQKVSVDTFKKDGNAIKIKGAMEGKRIMRSPLSC